MSKHAEKNANCNAPEISPELVIDRHSKWMEFARHFDQETHNLLKRVIDNYFQKKPESEHIARLKLSELIYAASEYPAETEIDFSHEKLSGVRKQLQIL